MSDLANALPHWKGTCRQQRSGLGGWGRTVAAVSTVNREKAQKLKGAESEISLTPIALVAGETVVCPRFTDLPRFTTIYPL